MKTSHFLSHNYQNTPESELQQALGRFCLKYRFRFDKIHIDIENYMRYYICNDFHFINFRGNGPCFQEAIFGSDWL